MRYSWLLLFASLTCFSSQAAQVYQYIDEHGNRVFTDKPPKDADAKEIKLPEINSSQPPVHIPSYTNRQTSSDEITNSAPYQEL